MRVIENRSVRLVLRSRPWALAALIGGPLLVLGLVTLTKLAQGASDEAGKAALVTGLMALAFAVFVRENVAQFDRASGRVLLASRSILGRRGTLHALADIRTARLENDPDGERSRSGKPLARPVLVTAAGKVLPLRWAYTVDPGDEAAVRAIRAWPAPQGRKARGRG
jgi:hypothetical protein